jgi:hypothetical protein
MAGHKSTAFQKEETLFLISSKVKSTCVHVHADTQQKQGASSRQPPPNPTSATPEIRALRSLECITYFIFLAASRITKQG